MNISNLWSTENIGQAWVLVSGVITFAGPELVWIAFLGQIFSFDSANDVLQL